MIYGHQYAIIYPEKDRKKKREIDKKERVELDEC